MKKIIALTGGENTPSAKFRIRQYIDPLSKYDINIHESYTDLGSFYSNKMKISKTNFVIQNLISRLNLVFKQYEYDIVFLQRELISTLYTYELFLKKPLIFDVDDAIFLNNRGKFYAQNITKKADLIICGNNYLANYYTQYTSKIEVLPTPVDTEKYKKIVKNINSKFIIGWIGTSSNFCHLEMIEDAISNLLNRFQDLFLVIISDKEFNFKSFRSNRIVNKKWNSETDVYEINQFDLGIMPLIDNEWSKGKCSYKLLQYMSCELPVIASNVGMNIEVLKNNNSGFLANNNQDWINYIEYFYKNKSSLIQYGINGRDLVNKKYSLKHCVNSLQSIIKKY